MGFCVTAISSIVCFYLIVVHCSIFVLFCFVCLLRVKKASNTGFDLLLSFAFEWQLESTCRLLRLDFNKKLIASKL